MEADIRNAVAALKRGDTILYPTDTIWGLGCDATNEAAVEKIFALKHRPAGKSLVVLLADARDILQYAVAPPGVIALTESFETPTTVVYKGALGLAANVVADDGSVAIRVVADPFCQALIRQFGGPVVSTSANISGQPAPAFFREVDARVVAGAGYVAAHRQDDEEPRRPSSIVRLHDDGCLEVLRP